MFNTFKNINRIRYPYIFAILIFLLTGCANTRNSGELWSYGKFCGPGQPETHSKSKESAISELRSISPIDHIDLACKLHDICYAKFGYYNERCDRKLLKLLNEMRFKGTYSTECTNVKEQIYIAFKCSEGILRSVNNDKSIDPLTLLFGSIYTIYPNGFMCSLRTAGGLLFRGIDTPDIAGKCNVYSFPIYGEKVIRKTKNSITKQWGVIKRYEAPDFNEF